MGWEQTLLTGFSMLIILLSSISRHSHLTVLTFFSVTQTRVRIPFGYRVWEEEARGEGGRAPSPNGDIHHGPLHGASPEKCRFHACSLSHSLMWVSLGIPARSAECADEVGFWEYTLWRKVRSPLPPPPHSATRYGPVYRDKPGVWQTGIPDLPPRLLSLKPGAPP